MYTKLLNTVLNKNNNIQRLRIIFKRTLATNPTHPNILVSESSDVIVPNVAVTEFLFPKLEIYDRFTATVCASTGRSYTFEQVKSKSKKLSKALRHIFKLKKGDVVAIFLPNKAEYAIAIFGLLDAGLVVTSLNPIYTPVEISKQLLDSSAKLIITQQQSVNIVKAALQILRKTIPIIAIKSQQNESVSDGIIDFEELVNSNIDIPDVDVSSTDLAFLPYSSGTTGLPKGVELTHSNIVSNICQINHDDFNYHSPPTENYQDVTPGVLPFFHIYGLMLTVLVTAHNGLKTVAIDKFSPELYVSVLKKYPVSIIYAAPPLVLFLSSSPLVKPEDLKHLKLLTSAAAPLGFSDEQRIFNKIANKQCQIVQGYGLTETSPVITYTPKYMRRIEENGGTIGAPLSNTMVKIINPDDIQGTPLGPNEKGELLIKGPQVMKGYHNREEETKNTFVDGWFRTGDIGYYNNDKLLFITDRLKELIKVKGFQVAPAELEAIIRDHPSIEDAAVIGIPHAQNGEIPRAYVVRKKTANVNAEEIKSHVAKQVAKYKELAGGVKFIDAIPRNPSGKILRRQLKTNFIDNDI